MARTLKDKLDEEYELFYLKMVGSSKANLFAKSQEIEMKKSDMAYVAFALLFAGACEYCRRWCFKKAEYYQLKAESYHKTA